MTVGAGEVLPNGAHIGVFQQCDDKVSALSKKDLRKHIPLSKCKDLDKDRLEELGVKGCAKSRDMLGRLAMEFHCGEAVAKQVEEACTVSGDPATLSKDCVTKVSESVENWSPSDAFEPFGEQTPESSAAVLALMTACQKGLKKPGGNIPIDDWCKEAGDELGADNLKAMGVSDDKCKKQVKKLYRAQILFMCSVPPDDMDPAEVTADWLKKHVEDRVDKEATQSGSEWQGEVDKVLKDAARLRLYQVVTKGWPTKSHGMTLKSIGVPGAALATMVAAVVLFTWGLRRSHLRTADLGDEMLEHTTLEESPE